MSRRKRREAEDKREKVRESREQVRSWKGWTPGGLHRYELTKSGGYRGMDEGMSCTTRGGWRSSISISRFRPDQDTF